MKLLDSHLHFDTFCEAGTEKELIERAQAAGVAQMIAIGGSAAANQTAVSLAADYSGTVFATVGMDRDIAGQTYDGKILSDHTSAPGVCAIGETGLDYYYGEETRAEQIRLFQEMLALAVEKDLPVVVHTRDAEEDTLQCLADYVAFRSRGSDAPGVAHCFTGRLSYAEKLLDLGFYISFSGIVTFRRADEIREVAKAAPLDRILIETDAPYLAPVPHRGKTNEPAWVRHVAETLAEVRGERVEHIAERTRANAIRLFGLPE